MESDYYKLLKKQFPSKEAVLTEIINLGAICELPKGTEHFVSDLHGEYDAFNHVLRNGSGSIKEKIKDCFPKMPLSELTELSTLIYYPHETLLWRESRLSADTLAKDYQKSIHLLLEMLRFTGRKYTRSKVRKTLPEAFRYIIEELLNESGQDTEKQDYLENILETIASLNQTTELIEALANSIRRLTVDHLHVVGDIYDRGPHPELIMDRLIALPSVDIQWGNHDIAWMAILAGSPLAMVNVIRICARYGNLDTLEEAYGINLRPLIEYASKYYQPSPAFKPKLTEAQSMKPSEQDIMNVLQQASMMLQMKLESQLIARRPDFQMEHRDLLKKIDYATSELVSADKGYFLVDFQAPTVNPENPSALTDEEAQLLSHLMSNFQASEKFKRHMNFLLEKGSIYLCYNDNLLLHGCLPLTEKGDFKALTIEGKSYKGKDLLDFFDQKVRESMAEPDQSDDLATDLLWYLWVGETSSLFGKHAMTTFERYYIADKTTHLEKKNAYYALRDHVSTVQKILCEFGLSKQGHIINGHTPVHEKDGENPIKANGQLIVIDGGFSKAYQKETGIAGYTLLYNSYGLQLIAHQPFEGVQQSVEKGLDIVSIKRLVKQVTKRKKVKDTNIGQQLIQERNHLEFLYQNYEKY